MRARIVIESRSVVEPVQKRFINLFFHNLVMFSSLLFVMFCGGVPSSVPGQAAGIGSARKTSTASADFTVSDRVTSKATFALLASLCPPKNRSWW